MKSCYLANLLELRQYRSDVFSQLCDIPSILRRIKLEGIHEIDYSV